MVANPSTVWTQLSVPNPASGSVPFIDTDNATPITDVLNFAYTSTSFSLPQDTRLAGQLTISAGLRVDFTDTSAVPSTVGAMNKIAGRIAIPAGQQAVTITNTFCFLSSLVQVQLENNDTTLTHVSVSPANGSFTVTGNAAATGIVKMNFNIINVF